jgi:hypothetical protein
MSTTSNNDVSFNYVYEKHDNTIYNIYCYCEAFRYDNKNLILVNWSTFYLPTIYDWNSDYISIHMNTQVSKLVDIKSDDIEIYLSCDIINVKSY